MAALPSPHTGSNAKKKQRHESPRSAPPLRLMCARRSGRVPTFRFCRPPAPFSQESAQSRFQRRTLPVSRYSRPKGVLPRFAAGALRSGFRAAGTPSPWNREAARRGLQDVCRMTKRNRKTHTLNNCAKKSRFKSRIFRRPVTGSVLLAVFLVPLPVQILSLQQSPR